MYAGMLNLAIEIIRLRDFLPSLPPPSVTNADFYSTEDLACFL